MKKIAFLMLTLISLSACKKDEKTEPIKEEVVFYIYDNDSKDKLYMRNAYWYSTAGRTGIRAGNGSAISLEINWEGDNEIALGNKTLTASKGFVYYFNDFTYYRDGGLNSRMTISAFDSEKMSGDFNFSMKGDNNLIKNVRGGFEKISKQ